MSNSPGDGSLHGRDGQDKSKASERLASFAKNVAKKTANLGRRHHKGDRMPTNPVSLAARTVFRESIKASKWTLHALHVSTPQLPRTIETQPYGNLHSGLCAGHELCQACTMSKHAPSGHHA